VRTVPAFALGMILSATASAQQQASVNVTNLSFQTVEIRVFDDVCRVMLYQGVLVDDASTTVSCCADGTGRCSLSIYDQYGRLHDYPRAIGTIVLRAR
jgi:hypothetical protein